MIQSALLKLNSLLFGGMKLSSLFAADGDVVSTVDPTQVSKGLFITVSEGIVDFFTQVIYTACTFVMSLMELMQYVIMSMIGIDVELKDYVVIDYNNPLIKIISSESFTRSFRYIIGISILLVIIFTIFSIVKSEYNFAAKDGPFVSKGRIFSRSLRSFFIMGIFPMFFLFAIIMTNAILAGFNDILKAGDNAASIGGQIFVSGSYNANNYRKYARSDSRIPISINFSDPISSGKDMQYTDAQLHTIYSEFEDKGKMLYGNFTDVNFGSFSDTVIYKNNKIINQASYSGYENFFCTREQYYVLADFIDYAVKYNLNYHVKNIADPDIDWGYVDETIFSKEDGTLTITYRDMDYLNDGVSYTVVYAPDSLDVSTPISDALDTISALLGIGKYSDNTFNILSRLEDAINVVEWETDKVWLQFSQPVDPSKINEVNELLVDVNGNGVFDHDIDYNGDGPDESFYDLNDDGNYTKGYTEADRIIFYERYKFNYNNTLHHSLNDLANGVELPLYKLEKRQYQASTSSYNVYEEHYVAIINGTYYAVEENKNLRKSDGSLLVDEHGDYYYTLVEPASHSDLVWDSAAGRYNKDDISAWSEVAFEKSNGTFEVNVPAEPITYDINGDGDTDDPGENYDGNGNGRWDEGEEFIDLNGNGYYDDAYTYYVMYDDQVNEVIKQTGWPQKLINDLQVIYADININNMITTNKWLEQLGDFVVGKGNSGTGEGTNNVSSALIHPLGLIMAEFFLGEVDTADNSNSFGSQMFSSKFDEKTIKAFLLSMMGEDNYFQLKAELEYFCEIFNVFMGPVLDEIAYFENFDLVSGNDASVQLYTYKAYLASVMLSASTAEWMYKTADKLLGNATFNREIYYSNYNDEKFGQYKPFSAFGTSCSACGGDGVYDDGSDCHEGCEGCSGTGKLTNGKPCTNVTTCRTTTAYEIATLFLAQKKNLKDQDIDEDDTSYPEYMVALEEYINGGAGGFDDRLNMVLSSYLSSVAREKQVVLAHKELTDAYNALIAACGTQALKDQVNSIIYIPKAQYVAVDRSGDEWSPYGSAVTINGTTYQPVPDTEDVNGNGILDVGEDKNRNNKIDPIEIVSFVNKTSSDPFTMLETEGAVQDLKEAVVRFKNIMEAQEIWSTVSGSAWNAYETAVLKYMDKKLDYFEEDYSASNAGNRGWLKAQLAVKKVPFSLLLIANGYDLLDIGDNPVSEFYKNLDKWNKLKEGYLEDVSGNDVNISENKTLTDANGNVLDVASHLVAESYISTQTAIDRLDRYNITYGISQLYAQNTDIRFDVTVNNKTYTVGQNFTQAKFIEYVMGAKYLKDLNIDVIFVEEDYEGLLEVEGNSLVGSYQTLLDFLVELGDISAVVCQMTNFSNLTDNAQDQILIGSQEIDPGSGSYINLSSKILQMIISEGYLAPDLVCAMFGETMPEITFDKSTGKYSCSAGVFDTKTEALEAIADDLNSAVYAKLLTIDDPDADRILNNVLSYLFLTEGDSTKKTYIDYTKLTLKELRLMAFDFLINYEDQEGESAEQNKNRYMAVFDLACSDWYERTNGERYALNSSWMLDRKADIKSSGGIKKMNQSRATVLRLAGLENRPYEELVGAEYTIDFDRNGVDEANGDVFIMCTYDAVKQLYVPFLMANTVDYEFDPSKGYEEVKHKSTEKTWVEDYRYTNATTQYYMEEKYYPVVAKGVITADGLPTAIRKVGDNIEFYRDDVIIHNVSDIGLSEYYVSMDQVTVNHTAISFVANAFSKLFTGKSLVENIASKIPKFSTTTNYNFCYGTERQVIAKASNGSVAVDFNFKDPVCVPMDALYDVRDINLLVLVIGTYTLFIALWKSLWGVTQRMFDVATLYLLGPVAISTIAMRGDSSDKDGNIIESNQDIYSNWKETLIKKTVNVFSYAIGFNVFFLITPVIFKVNLFNSQLEYNAALSFSSVFKEIDVNYINEVGRLVLLSAAAYLTTRGTDIFTSIMSIENAIKEGGETYKNVKNTITEVADHVSGQYALDKVQGAIDDAKHMIPGYELAKEVSEKVKAVSNKVVSKVAMVAMMAYGVPPEEADKLAKELEKKMHEQDAKDKKFKEDKKKARDKRESTRAKALKSSKKKKK